MTKTWRDLISEIEKILPQCQFEIDEEEQVIIYTGIQEDELDNIVPNTSYQVGGDLDERK